MIKMSICEEHIKAVLISSLEADNLSSVPRAIDTAPPSAVTIDCHAQSL